MKYNKIKPIPRHNKQSYDVGLVVWFLYNGDVLAVIVKLALEQSGQPLGSPGRLQWTDIPPQYDRYPPAK